MQIAEVNSNVAQTLAPTFGDLAMSISKVTNFGRGVGLMFVQNADVKIWDQFLCKMTAPKPYHRGPSFCTKVFNIVNNNCAICTFVKLHNKKAVENYCAKCTNGILYKK